MSWDGRVVLPVMTALFEVYALLMSKGFPFGIAIEFVEVNVPGAVWVNRKIWG